MTRDRFLAVLLLIASSLLLVASGDPPPMQASADDQAELAAAFENRLQAPTTKILTFDLFHPELDTAFISPDGKTAVLWLALRDDSGRLLATEPGLALAIQGADGWQVLLPGDVSWEEALAALPEGMLPVERTPAPEGVAVEENAITTLYGYYLPYAAGTARWLEGSISHFQYLPELGYPSCDETYCRYAYDFTDSWHFPLLASKDGTVVGSRDSCSDGSPTCTNYIVLHSSSDGAYQIYLHLAYGTIPDKLTPGTGVKRGQYIGDSDDTGYSTSQHVHFMVTNDLWMGNSGYYWGHSIDVRFADVTINYGIPRNCYEVVYFPIYDGATQCLGNKADPRNPANDWYVSGNVGAYPPTGSLTRPAVGAVVASGTSPLIDVTATASDDVRATAVRLVVRLNGQWVEAGPKVSVDSSGMADWDVDLCAAAPLNGPLEVALRAWDHEGNVSSALAPRTIQVDHACPPPTSQLLPVETFDSTAVRLSWDAASAGAGLSSIQLQWSSTPNSWDPANTLTFPASQRSAWFAGQPGTTYYFRLRALDSNGQAEAWPGGAETSATLPASCQPDEHEEDDDPDRSRDITQGEWAQGNLCGASDPDWYRVELDQGVNYLVGAASQSGGAAARITVYSGNGSTVMASSQAAEVGLGTALRFTPPSSGFYYVKVEPLTGNLMGTQAVYGIVIAEAKEVYLPLMGR
jgi:hypothetical protein